MLATWSRERRERDAAKTRAVFGALSPVAADLLHLAQEQPSRFLAAALGQEGLLERIARCEGSDEDWLAMTYYLARTGALRFEVADLRDAAGEEALRQGPSSPAMPPTARETDREARDAGNR